VLYSDLMDLIVRLGEHGLIHSDFNEFNLLIRESDGSPILIDFPQMISTSHQNATYYFNRDVDCIRSFFKRRFGYECEEYPRLEEDVVKKVDLDVQVAASGFQKKWQEQLEQYQQNAEKGSSDDHIEDIDSNKEESIDEGDALQRSAKQHSIDTLNQT